MMTRRKFCAVCSANDSAVSRIVVRRVNALNESRSRVAHLCDSVSRSVSVLVRVPWSLDVSRSAEIIIRIKSCFEYEG